MAYSELEPFGTPATDALNAYGISVLANVNRDAKKRSEPYRLEDFLLFKDRANETARSDGILLEDPEAQTELMISAMFGGMNVIRA